MSDILDLVDEIVREASHRPLSGFCFHGAHEQCVGSCLTVGLDGTSFMEDCICGCHYMESDDD